MTKKTNIPSVEIAYVAQSLRKQTVDLQTADINTDSQFSKNKIVRNSIRLLTLAERGNALSCTSLAYLLNLQVILLDAFVQSDELILKKIRSLLEN